MLGEMGCAARSAFYQGIVRAKYSYLRQYIAAPIKQINVTLYVRKVLFVRDNVEN